MASSNGVLPETVHQQPQENGHVTGYTEYPCNLPDLCPEMFTKFEPSHDDHNQPFYYPTQQIKANILLDHIEYILKFYHNKNFEDFTEFEIQLYTANAKSLQEQTLSRLLRPDAKCFAPEFYTMDQKSQYQYANERVSKYTKGKKECNRHEKLKEKVLKNPKTLFLIVADEAHWGTSGIKTGDKEEAEAQAHDKFINHWNHKEHPNVVVLQVSATPYSLLTINKRLPSIDVVRDCNHEILAVNPDNDNKVYGYRCVENYEKKEQGVHLNDTYTARSLHYIEWSEGLHEEMKGGMLVYLQVPYANDILWVKIVHKPDTNSLRLQTTTQMDEREELLMESTDTNDVYKIYTPDKLFRLAVTLDPRTCNNTVELCPSYKQSVCDEFFIRSFGEDVIEIKAKQMDGSLAHFTKNCEITLERNACNNNNNKKDPSVEFGVILYSKRRQRNDSTGKSNAKQYMSLNHVYNSMRMADPKERLLRGDPYFHHVSNYVQHQVSFKDGVKDRTLICEYAMFLIMLPLLKSFRPQCNVTSNTNNVSVVEFLENDDNFQAYYQIKREKFSLYAENGIDRKIKTVFEQVCNHYMIFPNCHQRCLPEERIMWYMLFGNSAQGVLHVINNDDECIMADWGKFIANFESIKKKVLSQLETYNIVNDLAIEIKGNEEVNKGHMKIIRVSKEIYGNELHKTLCTARNISNHRSENPTYFEVIRDYKTFELNKLDKKSKGQNEITDEKMKNILFQIRSKMQTMSCQNISQKNETCNCTSYKAISENDLQCRCCGHIHKEIKQYEDLNGLPCLLVILNKGRLGDTFPSSMSCMDLRLAGNTTMVSCIQQQGRLCRYVSKQQGSNKHYPSAVLRIEFINKLKNCLKTCVTFNKALHESLKNADSRMTREEGAKENHFDHKNTEKHWNRILLKAEPQIGKTGVYLNVIKQLREIIERPKDDVDEVSIASEADDSEMEYEDDEIETESEVSENESSGDEKQNESDDDSDILNNSLFPLNTSQNTVENTDAAAQQHRKKGRKRLGSRDALTPRKRKKLEEWVDLPHWKVMQNGKYLKTKIEKSKYTRMFGAYKYKTPPQKIPISDRKAPIQKFLRLVDQQSEEYDLSGDQYKALKVSHKLGCSKCRHEVHVKPLTFNSITMGEIAISVPIREQYYPVIDTFGIGSDDVDDEINEIRASIQQSSKSRLESWIFTPSYGRSDTASVNLAHTMVDSNNQDCNFVHILVVREEEYQSYCEKYMHTHCVMRLPNNIPGFGKQALDGGIGYARKFIQRLSEELELETIFMIDDNTTCIIDAKETQNTEGQKVQLVSVPFYQVFKILEDQILGKSEVPDMEFEPYPGEIQSNVERFTGPCGCYGILGITKYRPGSLNIVNCFSKSHVTSLVAINVNALQSKHITYEEWPVFEDLEINNDCDTNNIWVCKNLRYQLMKRQMNTWQPRMYTWTEQTSLPAPKKSVQLRGIDEEKEVDLAFKWLRETAIPSRVERSVMVNDDRWRSISHKAQLITVGKSNRQLILINRIVLDEELQAILNQNEDTKEHVFFISTDVCRNQNLASWTAIDKLLVKLFESNYTSTILTTHNVQEYKVGIVLVHVIGKAKKYNVKETSEDTIMDFTLDEDNHSHAKANGSIFPEDSARPECLMDDTPSFSEPISNQEWNRMDTGDNEIYSMEDGNDSSDAMDNVSEDDHNSDDDDSPDADNEDNESDSSNEMDDESIDDNIENSASQNPSVVSVYNRQDFASESDGKLNSNADGNASGNSLGNSHDPNSSHEDTDSNSESVGSEDSQQSEVTEEQYLLSTRILKHHFARKAWKYGREPIYMSIAEMQTANKGDVVILAGVVTQVNSYLTGTNIGSLRFITVSDAPDKSIKVKLFKKIAEEPPELGSRIAVGLVLKEDDLTEEMIASQSKPTTMFLKTVSDWYFDEVPRDVERVWNKIQVNNEIDVIETDYPEDLDTRQEAIFECTLKSRKVDTIKYKRCPKYGCANEVEGEDGNWFCDFHQWKPAYEIGYRLNVNLVGRETEVKNVNLTNRILRLLLGIKTNDDLYSEEQLSEMVKHRVNNREVRLIVYPGNDGRLRIRDILV